MTDDYFASERFAAYLEWIQTAYDYGVITYASGVTRENPYRASAWRAYVATADKEREGDRSCVPQ